MDYLGPYTSTREKPVVVKGLIARRPLKATRELNTGVPSSMSGVMESRITVSCPGDALARLAIDWLCPSALIHHVIFV